MSPMLAKRFFTDAKDLSGLWVDNALKIAIVIAVNYQVALHPETRRAMEVGA
jgi:hypothetical protein